MNGLSLTPLLTGTAMGQPIGTLSAKPQMMIGNTLPFRLQLEASTAPIPAAGKIPALDGEERFALPKFADELGDRFAPRTTDQGSPGDTQSSDDRDDTPDASLPALAMMVHQPEYCASSARAIAHAPEADVANGAPFADLKADAIATGSTTEEPIVFSAVRAPTEAPIASDLRIPVPTPPTAHPSAAARPHDPQSISNRSVATILPVAAAGPIADAAVEARSTPSISSALPKVAAPQVSLGLAQRTDSASEATESPPPLPPARTRLATPQPQALPAGSPVIATAATPVLNIADGARPAATVMTVARPNEHAPSPSSTVETASSSSSHIAQTMPSTASHPGAKPADDTVQGISDRGAPMAARHVLPGPEGSATPNVSIRAPAADGASTDIPAPITETATPRALPELAIRYSSPRSTLDATTAEPLAVASEVAADTAHVASAKDRPEPDRRQTPEVRGERSIAADTAKSPATEPAPRAQFTSHQPSYPAAVPLRPGYAPAAAQPPAANVAPDGSIPALVTSPQESARAEPMLSDPALGVARFERRVPAAAPRSAERTDTKATIDRVSETRIEPGARAQPFAALAPARTNAHSAAQSVPMLAADVVAPPTQIVATQTQAAPAGEATQPNLTPSVHIPFDQNFGQRVGAAIGAAMNAMSIKNGMLLLQISPDRLGKIEIEIDSKMERLQIITDNEAVRGAIAQAHGRIEHELRQAGQRIATIDIETRDSAGSQLNHGAADQRGGQNSGQHPVHGRPDLRARMHDQGGSQSSDPDSSRPASNVLYA